MKGPSWQHGPRDKLLNWQTQGPASIWLLPGLQRSQFVDGTNGLGQGSHREAFGLAFNTGTMTEHGRSLCHFSACLHLAFACPLQPLRQSSEPEFPGPGGSSLLLLAPLCQAPSVFPSPRCGRGTHLQLLQLLHQGPAAHEALVQQGEDGRTFQDSLPESSPRAWQGRRQNLGCVSSVTVAMFDATTMPLLWLLWQLAWAPPSLTHRWFSPLLAASYSLLLRVGAEGLTPAEPSPLQGHRSTKRPWRLMWAFGKGSDPACL